MGWFRFLSKSASSVGSKCLKQIYQSMLLCSCYKCSSSMWCYCIIFNSVWSFFVLFTLKSMGSHVFVSEKGCVKSQIECDNCDVCQNLLFMCIRYLVESSWNVMAHGDARVGKWRGNWRMEWVASTLHTTLERGVSSITTADVHTSAASSSTELTPLPI